MPPGTLFQPCRNSIFISGADPSRCHDDAADVGGQPGVILLLGPPRTHAAFLLPRMTDER
jgi:hypothetical protein